MSKCTGKRCPMQVGYDVANCKITLCDFRTEPITNYERIKNMGVEELAGFLENTNASLAIKLCDNYVVKEKIYIKQWLETEVEE